MSNMYEAKNIDSEKVLNYLTELKRKSEYQERLERVKIEEHYSGYREGIEDATRIFYCKNYEKEAKS